LLRRERTLLREPRAYLTTVARGLLVDHWRRRDLEQAWLQARTALPEALAPSPEERQLAVELLLQIDAMLAGLRPPVRTAFLLAQIEGICYDDIAARLGVSRRSVERYIAEALFYCYTLRHAY
jgi:RNA polymerase sigma-70 factor (ECF subfamily)